MFLTKNIDETISSATSGQTFQIDIKLLDSSIIGYLIFFKNSSGILEISDFEIFQEFRNLGYGRKFFSLILSRFYFYGFRQFEFDVLSSDKDISQEKLLEFYRTIFESNNNFDSFDIVQIQDIYEISAALS